VRDEHFIGGELVVKRKRRAVLDAVGDRILMQVTLIVLAAKGLEGAFAVNGLVHRGASEAKVGRVWQTGHEEITKLAASGAMGLVDEDVDVRAHVEIRRHVAEFMDHRHDDAPVVVLQQLVEPPDTPRMLQISQTQRGEVLEHLVLQLVAVDHQQDSRLVRLGRTEKPLRRLDHCKSFAATLSVPDKTSRSLGIKSATDSRIHRPSLMLSQNVFVQLLILFGKDDVVLQERKNFWDGTERFDLGFQTANPTGGGTFLSPRFPSPTLKLSIPKKKRSLRIIPLQFSLRWILPDILSHLQKVPLISNQAIPILHLPKRTLSSYSLVDCSRRETLPGL
jgi:hypothetical protein